MKTDIIHQFPENHLPFNILSAETNLDGLVKLFVDESNFYTQQDGREFPITIQDMRAFLRINYIMSINKLPTIKSSWECGQFIGNEGIRNVVARSRFDDILQKLHISNNTKDDKSDKGYKVRSLINHFNQIFSNSVSNDDAQSIDRAPNNMSKTSQSNGFSSFDIVVLVKQDTSINLICSWIKKKVQKKIWDQMLF